MKEPLDEYLAKTDLDNFETDNIGTQTKKVSLYGFDTTDLTKKRITVKETDGEVGLNVSGSELQSIAGLSIPAHDYIAATYPTASQEVYTYKTGGASGTTVATVTIVYTDATKNVLTSVTKV